MANLRIAVFVVLSGMLFTKFRFYQVYLLIGASFTAIGAGLLYTLKADSYAGEYIGFQFVVGFGNGVCQQIPLTVVQAFSKPEDLALSMSTILCKSNAGNRSVLYIISAIV
jgi:MFS transporter, DHA2 family, glioxin efflux transporter